MNRHVRSKTIPASFALVLLLSLVLSAVVPVAAADRSDAERLLKQAIEAPDELRQALLLEAVQIAPDWQLPHWHLGQIQLDGRWVSVEEAQEAAQQDPSLTRYERLRHLQDQGVPGWLRLARFCAMSDLEDRETFYWSAVLRAQPGNTLAVRALRLQPYNGALLTERQIAAWEEYQAKWELAEQQWRQLLKDLRSQIEKGDSTERAAAIEELRSIDEPDAAPFLYQVFNGASREDLLEVMAALGNIEDPVSTNLLVRCAVLSPHPDVRQAAAVELQTRSYFEFVPVLMGALAAPIEITVSASPLFDGGMASVRLEREGPTATFASNVNYRVHQTRPGGRPARGGNGLGLQMRMADFQLRTAMTAANVATSNAQASMLNQRIDAVLRTVTEEQNEGSPLAWWDWWQEYNDLYIPEEKPRYESEENYTVQIVSCECFLPGTLVWTETGLTAIDKIRLGDRVLSQDPDTGELAYKVVLQRTVRPETSSLRVGIDDNEVFSTLGHPFWVAGKGWRMARRLEPGWQLHTPDGPKEIRHVEPGPESEAHNMVVADFHSYFVGKAGILVHDNTLRRPTRSVLPGIAGR